ncbi:MAG: T9SS type A sorting domain-containing protein [Melioribacteraceae bacterium]
MKKKILFSTLLIVITATITSAQWKALNTTFGSDIRVLAKAGNSLFAATNGGGVYYSANSEQNWIQRNSGLTNLKVYSLAVSGTTIAAGTYGNGVFISNNNGEAWTSTASGISVPYIYALAYMGGNILAGTGGGGFFRSANNGSNWVSAGGTTHIVNSFYVAQNYSFVGQGPYAYKTTDNGNTWTTLIGSSSTTVKGFAETPRTGGGTNIFVGTLDGVYISTDDAKSWKTTNSGLTYKNVNAIVATGQNLFVATEDGGVFRSSDNGSTWNTINTGLPTNTNGRTLILSNGALFLGTSEGVVWKRDLSDLGITSVKQVASEIPSAFELSQNYPNPFNPETNISYKLQTASQVSLKVYDVLGNEVATLVNEYQQAGKYNFELSINKFQLSSGFYLYTLKAGSFSSTKKMLLIK